MRMTRAVFKRATRQARRVLMAGLCSACSWLSVADTLTDTHGSTAPSDTRLSDQRGRFLETEKALAGIWGTPSDALLAKIESLSDYPLYPYLQRMVLERTFLLSNRDEIESFLKQHEGRPVVYGLREQWLNYLATHNQYDAFMASYRDNLSTRLTCQKLRYELNQATQPDLVLARVDSLWLNGQSQPKACDPLFSTWQKKGMMTPEKVLGRIEKAATGGSVKLVSYLKRKLPDDMQYLADRWRDIRRNPAAITRYSRFPLRYPQQEAAMISWGMERLAWRDAPKTIDAYYRWQKKLNFTAAQLMQIHRAIALSLAIDDAPEALTWLQRANVPGADDDVARWHVAHLLRHEQWQAVLQVIASVDAARQNDEAFLYWQARAYSELGMEEQASALFDTLAGQRHYYGFLASARLKRVPSLAHTPVPVDQLALQQVAAQPAARRAYEFYQMERFLEARREWRYLMNTLNSDDVKYLAVLASEWGWHDQAIMGFAQSGYWNDVERRFPLAFTNEFNRISQQYSVPQAFAMAIARRESSFMPDAVSPAGATGLMQLMPNTAAYLAERRVSRQTLFEPQQNVQLGVRYLRYLMDKMNDDPVLVSASYNAGWQRVVDWLPQQSPIPTDIWIETIPYRETRDYVKAVLAYRYIYETQLGQPTNLFESLTDAIIPPSGMLQQQTTASRQQLAPE
ncbi:transglycosylase SLT domain-containing protein [Alteromonas sp. CYL-A6]|uniref:transglycosylase SLT domain-containing protein n=1 Tax=Alteromonas nitratireducens TaxID=3390813 RepID=UPI0034B73338